MSVPLRPYQADAIERVREAFRGGARAPLLVAPTGAGKTVMFSYIAGTTAERGKRVLILCHRRELIRQASHKLYDAGVQHGIIAPGFTPTRDLVQVASVQTLGRRLHQERGAPDLIVVDEAHHAVAGQWSTICAAYPRALLLGVTATPERLDGRGLGVSAGGCFDSLVLGPTVMDLISGGFLTPTRIFAPPQGLDLSGIRTKAGDYDSHDLTDEMSRPRVVGDAVEHYGRHAAGLPAILFSPSVAHAQTMADALCADGWRAVAASGSTPGPQRDAAIAGLATGAVQVLCSCDLISEGLDVPAVGAVILLRPTQSLGLYLQQVGRGLRPAPGKTHLIVLDHAGNTVRHGPPQTERAWSLDGRPRKEPAPPTRQCPECFAVFEPAPVCPECGFAFPVAGRTGRAIDHVHGDLMEISGEMPLPAADRWGKHRPLKEVLREARDEDLPKIAAARGYAKGWAWHVRQQRRAGASA